MTTALELLRQGRRDEIWKKYCGFIDLSLEEFMEIQKHLLMEQTDLLSRCELGRKLLGNEVPTNVQQFRARVPLTTYADYAPYLMEKREDILPCKPRWWLRTSGRSGEYGGFKWVPYSPRMVKKLGETVLALFILASCTRRGEFLFEEGDRMFYSMAPFPYMSGGVARAVMEEFPITFLPALEEAEAMEYQERIQKGLKLALREGVDHINAIAVVLVRIGEQFTDGSGGLIFLPYLNGERTPYWDPFARGVFYGLNLSTEKGHFIKAIMEGVSFVLRNNIETIESLGIMIDKVRAVGGGLKSPVWLDILGKILKKPLVTVSVQDTANLGNILLCGKALGIYPSLEEAIARMVTTDERVWYEASTEIYEKQYAIFLELYDQLKGTFKRSAFRRA